jgi:hypothetical protein
LLNAGPGNNDIDLIDYGNEVEEEEDQELGSNSDDEENL